MRIENEERHTPKGAPVNQNNCSTKNGLVQVNTLKEYQQVKDFYFCSPDGKVYGKGMKELKPTYYRNKKYKYRGLTLQLKGGGYIHKSVGRIIAIAFVEGRTEERKEVDHINGDASDNRAENLRWVSRRENLDFLRLRQYREGSIGSNAPIKHKQTINESAQIRLETLLGD